MAPRRDPQQRSPSPSTLFHSSSSVLLLLPSLSTAHPLHWSHLSSSPLFSKTTVCWTLFSSSLLLLCLSAFLPLAGTRLHALYYPKGWQFTASCLGVSLRAQFAFLHLNPQFADFLFISTWSTTWRIPCKNICRPWWLRQGLEVWENQYNTEDYLPFWEGSFMQSRLFELITFLCC